MPLAVVSSSAQRPRRARRRRPRRPVRHRRRRPGRRPSSGLPGKPAPDTFVHAADRAAAPPPAASVVVEDAVSGVRAGRGRRLRAGRSASTAASAPTPLDRGRCRPRRRRPRTSSSREAAREPRASADPLDRSRFPVDPWRLVETRLRPARPRRHRDAVRRRQRLPRPARQPRGGPRRATRTAPSSTASTRPGRSGTPRRRSASPRTGQTIVNVPDAKIMKLYVDDEPLSSAPPTSSTTSARLDFRDGVLRRSLRLAHAVGQAGAGRLHPDGVVDPAAPRGACTLEVDDARRRRPGRRSPRSCSTGRTARTSTTSRRRAAGRRRRPAQGGAPSTGGCCCRSCSCAHEDRMMLGYRCANSRMTVAVAADHHAADRRRRTRSIAARRGRPRQDGLPGRRDAGQHDPAREDRGLPHLPRACRCASCPTAAAAPSTGPRGTASTHYLAEQRAWFDDFWARSDVEVARRPRRALQQAIRWNLFQLAQASARADGRASPAKGVTGSGYEGHYFWDTEIYVAAVPHLHPARAVARNALRFRYRMLPAARERAARADAARARCSRGARSTARRPRPTTRPAPRSTTSTPTSRYALVQYVDATGDVGLPGPRGHRHPRRDRPAVGRPRLLAQQRRARPSTSTASPGPTSTRPSSTTTCSPT